MSILRLVDFIFNVSPENILMSLDTRRPITISSSRSSVLSLSECGATFTIEGGVAFLAPFLHGTEIGAYLSVCFSWLCQRPLFFVTKYDSLMLVLCPLTLSLSLLPSPLSLLLLISPPSLSQPPLMSIQMIPESM